MTIRFLKSWNGYFEGQIVSNPNGRTEADLIALGYAVADLDGPDNTPLPVTAVSNPLTGGIAYSVGNRSIEPLEANNKALLRFRTALAGRNSAPCNILHIGDSITWGYKAGSAANRWASKLRDALRQRFTQAPIGGFGFISVSDTFSPITLSDGFVTRVGGAVVTDNFGIDAQGYVISATGHKITYTFTGTGFDFFYARYPGGGSFYYKVDGGATTNVDTNGALTYGMRNSAIRSLSAGSHTVEIGWVSGNSYATGGFAYNGDESSGIRSTVAAWPSTASGYWWNPAKNMWLESIGFIQPALVTIELGPNDYSNVSPVSATAFKANLKNIISAIKARCTLVPSFVLQITWPLTPAAPSLNSWLEFAASMYEISAEDVDGAVSVDNWMPVTSGVAGTTVGGIIDADTAHPTPLGNQYLADHIIGFISP